MKSQDLQEHIVLVKNPTQNGTVGFVAALAFLVYISKFSERVHWKRSGSHTTAVSSQSSVKESNFWQKLHGIIGKTCGFREAFTVARLSLWLTMRTAGSVWVSRHWGNIVQSVVTLNFAKLSGLVSNFAFTTILLSGLNAMLKYDISLLKVQVREKISRWCHATYMRPNDMIYYKANKVGDDKIDNCDHRVTSDGDKFADAFAEVVSKFTKPVVDFLTYSVVLSRAQGLATPLTLYAWFAIASFVSSFTLPPLGELAATEQRLEGRYRSAHSDVITNCEQIAFLRGEHPEQRVLNMHLDKLVAHCQHALRLSFNSELLHQYLFKYFVTVIGLFLISRPLRRGTLPPEFLSEHVAGYFTSNWRNMEAMSTAIQDLFELTYRVGTLSGFAARLHRLMLGLETRPPVLVAETKQARKGWYPPTYLEGDVLKFEHVSIYKPDGTLLVKHLNLEVERGSRTLVTGGNGVGKSSLFRVIQKLWPLVEGTITMPPARDIHFLTQINFVPVGTLRDLVIYPLSHHEIQHQSQSDKRVMTCLRWAHVSPVVIRNNRAQLEFTDDGRIVRPELDDVRDWHKDLTPGQKQRIAFARLFYHKPAFVVLDECTNGVSPDVEHDLYERCAKEKMAVFSISHKNELKLFHDNELHYTGDAEGSWTLTPCSETKDKITRSSAVVRLPEPDESGKTESKITYERHIWFAE